MEFLNEDEPDLTLPRDSIHRARLVSITSRDVTNSSTNKTSTWLRFTWEITVPGDGLGYEYIGRRVSGECFAKMSNRDGNKLREWSEAILGREIPVGMTVDTDDLVGLEAEIIIDHEQDRKDAKKVWERVSAVLPIADRQSAEPPF